jgi:hypothetical protein
MEAQRRLTSSFFLVFLSLVLACAGCRSNCDLVEAELRTREFQLDTLRDEMHRLEAVNDALSRELQALRSGTAPSAEQASQNYSLRSLALGRLTGGLDDDGLPGDEALQVLVEPRDADGHSLKVSGTLVVAALEITPEGLKQPLCTWQLADDALRRSWRSGLLTTGYYLVLPWKKWPGTEKLRVVARLVLADGRAFEAERDVTIRVAPVEHRRPAAVEPPSEGPTLEPPTLPPPRSLDMPPGDMSSRRVPAPPPRDGTHPAAHWQKAHRPSLTDGIELLAPIRLPQRVEWSRWDVSAVRSLFSQ